MALVAASVDALAMESAALRELTPGDDVAVNRLVEADELLELEVPVEVDAPPAEEVSELEEAEEAVEEAVEDVVAAVLLEELLDELELREPPALVSLELTVLFMSTPEA
jgi:hypothetical protein